MKSRSAVGAYMGHDKEPPQPHGPRQSGRPLIHSHSARPKRHLKGTAIKASRKRGMR
jgi:hypothetical protein